jgi:hypothetical protein
MKKANLAVGIMAIFIALLLSPQPANAPTGDNYTVIAPIDFNTETLAAPITPWIPGGAAEKEIPEKPKPPVPIFRWAIERERTWLEDAMIGLAFAGIVGFFIFFFWMRRHGITIGRLKRRFKRLRERASPEIGV